MINQLLESAGFARIDFLTEPGNYWALLTIQNVWKEVGWDGLLVAIASVDVQLYKAALIDGAGRIGQMGHVVSFAAPEYFRLGGMILFPRKWTLLSYEYILSTKACIKAAGISGYLAKVGTAASLIITSMLAYGLSRRKLKGRSV